MTGHRLLLVAAAVSLFLLIPVGPTAGTVLHFGPATAAAQGIANPQCVDPTFVNANPRLCGRPDDKTVHNPSGEDANKPPEANPTPATPTQNGNAGNGNGGNGGQNNGDGNPPNKG